MAVAHITKAHGNKGKVVAVPVAGLPFLLSCGMHVAIVPPDVLGSRYHTVNSVEHTKAAQLVGFSGIVNRKDSEALVGKTVLVPTCELPADLALHVGPALIGRRVVDVERGLVGTIVELLQGPANDVWVLDVYESGHRGIACQVDEANPSKSTPSAHREVLIPVIDEVVCSVPERDPIPIHIPDGLL